MDPLDGDALNLTCHVAHRVEDARGDLEAELGGETGGAQHAKRVVAEGNLGGLRGVKAALQQVTDTVHRVVEDWTECAVDHVELDGHCVAGKVAPNEVTLEGVAERHLGVACHAVVEVGTERRDLHLLALAHGGHGAELDAGVPGRLAPLVENFLHGGGQGGRREVEVVPELAKHRVAHGPADEVEVLAALHEALGEGRQQATELFDALFGPNLQRRDGVRVGGVGEVERAPVCFFSLCHLSHDTLLPWCC